MNSASVFNAPLSIASSFSYENVASAISSSLPIVHVYFKRSSGLLESLTTLASYSGYDFDLMAPSKAPKSGDKHKPDY